MSADASVGIVLAGPAAGGKKALAAALLQLSALEPSPSPSASPAPALPAAASAALYHAVPWTLRTKYYRADLELRVVPSAEWSQPGARRAAYRLLTFVTGKGLTYRLLRKGLLQEKAKALSVALRLPPLRRPDSSVLAHRNRPAPISLA